MVGRWSPFRSGFCSVRQTKKNTSSYPLSPFLFKKDIKGAAGNKEKAELNFRRAFLSSTKNKK